MKIDYMLSVAEIKEQLLYAFRHNLEKFIPDDENEVEMIPCFDEEDGFIGVVIQVEEE